jgi:hypothetical protein
MCPWVLLVYLALVIIAYSFWWHQLLTLQTTPPPPLHALPNTHHPAPMESLE